ncbi:hypothetical protein DL767_006159 [Monosporascus sp. MG133]|nr:hypothetical protein DL767_006159 [Monosporascus sp. MG133]
MMGTRKYSINQQSPADLVKWSLRSLFKAVSLNGLCPGQVNEITQEPVLFDREEDRDYYFHARFEIPFVLLTNAVRINDVYGEQANLSEVERPHSPKHQSVSLRSDVGHYPQGRKVPPKHQQVSGEEKGEYDGRYPIYHTNATLQEELTKPRTAENAKKRLIWLPKANAETALVCYLASVDTEKPAISLFMDRHWNQEDYFFDDTTMVTNRLEAGLHLSFYQLTEQRGAGDIRTLSEDILPHKEAQITKASKGFRFLGDFFDRYWTCQIIENGIALQPDEPRHEDYFFSSAQWQRFQNALAAIEEKLEGVRLEVSKWETREKDRGKERPRWTRNDERKYGGIIKKLVRSTNKQITNLHTVHASVKSLKETLMRSQEQIRADLSLRGSEDIRFFTYVTVVFLPLGFAANIFSMSGNPGPDLVVSLVICAIIALVITVLPWAKMKHSILMQKGEVGNKEIHDEEAKGAKIGKPSGKDGFGNGLGERLLAEAVICP